jgi:hypothetical protein
MAYDAPGRADQLSAALRQRWNETIRAEYESLEPQWGSRFFVLDPAQLPDPGPAPIHWFADAAEPAFCIGADVARQLSDWGVKGRRALHNEYCEYRVIEGADAQGKLRPKRVEVTTELREYWVCIAREDPEQLRAMAADVLGAPPSWQDLYGVADPAGLTPQERERRFVELVAGAGASEPTGRLNAEHALFMTHPINGLDDLLYIVMFGARPYAQRIGGALAPATREQIFRAFGVEHLGCRHADPAAAMGAHGAAYQGRSVAFADPLGMYLVSFARHLFLYRGDPVPDAWVRWSRGQSGMRQRLVFGPGDADPAFLDDIRVAVGATEEPVTGGFQVVQQVEVGPLVVVGPPTPVQPAEYQVLTESTEVIRCHEARICGEIQRLQQEYDQAHPVGRVAPRTMGRIR